MASAEKLESCFDALVFTALGVSEQLVDLEPTDLFAHQVVDFRACLWIGVVDSAVGRDDHAVRSGHRRRLGRRWGVGRSLG